MIEFSEQSNSCYHGVSLKDCNTLLEVISQCRVSTLENVRRNFSKNAAAFDPIYKLLIATNLIKEDKSGVILNKELLHQNSKALGLRILDGISEKQTSYRTELFGYLRRFRKNESEIIHQSSLEERSLIAPIRNFLMEIGIVRYDKKLKGHIIKNEYAQLFLTAINSRKTVSPRALKKSLDDKATIGDAAEKAVLCYEINRLGEVLANQIQHTAKTNVAAGFDIISFTLVKNKAPIFRFIEVKAVPEESKRFYWSQNEITTALTLGNQYFLYLVPCNGKGELRIDLLEIIENPHKIILKPDGLWLTTSSVLECCLKK